MEFTLGHLKSPNTVHMRTFADSTVVEDSIIDLENALASPPQALFYSTDLLDEDLNSRLHNEYKFYPIFPLNRGSQQPADFATMNFEEGKTMWQQAIDTWCLHNNLSLLDELFPVLTHLKGLWPNERTSFFEELWFILKSNLGTSNLTLIYNDLLKPEKEGAKGQLIQVKITGTTTPGPSDGQDVERKLMDFYQKDFGPHFEISEYNPKRGELVILASINQSPILMMANVPVITPLQKSLMSALFDGLQGA